jgi:hypothetical protein
MATWRLLKRFLEEMVKVDNHRYGPGPMFWHDVDTTGQFPNKSELREALKSRKEKKWNHPFQG